MPSVTDCFICHKHKNLREHVGAIIAKRGGLAVTHFPFIEGEKATKGHLIVEPTRHITDLTEMNDAETNALGGLIRDGAKTIKNLLKAEHVYLFRINDKVAHLHFHLVPRYPGTPKDFWGAKIMDWPDRPTATLAEIQQLAGQFKESF